MTGFIDFIRRQGVVWLAIGFVIGGGVTKLVTSFVEDIVNPFVGVILGATSSLAQKSFDVGSVKILYGDFLGNLIDFVLVTLIVYACFRMLRLDRFEKPRL